MQRHFSILLAFAALSVIPAVPAQTAAPIERPYANARPAAPARITSTRPIPGIVLRAAPNASVQTISANDDVTEFRIDHGRANVSVHHPEKNVQILVDLPGGQTALLKDGLYTFNADTNTVRVLMGEADAFPGSTDNGLKVKEQQEFVFGASPHAMDIGPEQARADLLPGERLPRNDGYYRTAPYGGGFFYDYPYYPYAFAPYGYYPYGFYGPPLGFGFGFGYYGGFRGGYRGFHGHR